MCFLQVFRACHRNIDLIFFDAIRVKLGMTYSYWERKDCFHYCRLFVQIESPKNLRIFIKLTNRSRYLKISRFSMFKQKIQYNGIMLVFVGNKISKTFKFKMCVGLWRKATLCSETTNILNMSLPKSGYLLSGSLTIFSNVSKIVLSFI